MAGGSVFAGADAKAKAEADAFNAEIARQVEVERQKALASLEAQKTALSGQLAAEKAAAEKALADHQGVLTEMENSVFTQRRSLADDLVGFAIGIIPPALRTDSANANVRDPLYGVQSSAPPAPQKKPLNISLLLMLAALIYFYTRKGKRK